MLIEKPRIPVREVLLYGLWPNFVKKIIYRLKGFQIGKGVVIGFGSVICGEKVQVGDFTTIGFFTLLRGREIVLGSYVQIGSTTFLDTPYINIGEGSKINEQVFVGGLQFADSRFTLGRNCQVMQMTFINPARGVTVGDDSGIGGHCLIFGHNSWLNQLEGYAVDFAPITIGKSVSLSWRVFLLPGTQIGDGSVIGADSLVKGVIPPRCLAVGYPARVISKAPDYPKEYSTDERLALFRNIVAEMIRYFVESGIPCDQREQSYVIQKPGSGWWGKGGRWTLKVAYGEAEEEFQTDPRSQTDVLLSFHEIPGETRRALSGAGVVWVDVSRKERSPLVNELGEEVVLFLKRYGIRTLRVPLSAHSSLS